MLLKAIWGVYHADGGIVGELQYVFGTFFIDKNM